VTILLKLHPKNQKTLRFPVANRGNAFVEVEEVNGRCCSTVKSEEANKPTKTVYEEDGYFIFMMSL
jgi:hypothetical protein